MEFSGERYLPEMDINSEISIFHRQRYESIFDICKGKKVLDAACGEGYGSNFIAETAEQVIGIDISCESVENAKEKYKKENLKYIEASVEKIPIEDNWADVIVSYETIEHVAEAIQEKFLEEIKRILKKDGILIMSSPDKKNYSDIPKFQNEFHVRELYFEEFDSLIGKHFLHKKYYYQGMFCNSYIFDKKNGIHGKEKKIILRKPDDSRAEYLIVIASNQKLKEDISSVIYDNFNMYYLMKDEILRLKERLGNPGKIIEQKENYICEQREKIAEIEKELRETGGIVEQKENYICEQRGRIAEIESKLRETEGIIEQKENYICEQRERIAEIESKLRETEEIVEQKESYICEQTKRIEENQNYRKEQEEKIELIDNKIKQMKKEEQKSQDDFMMAIEKVKEELDKTRAELNINIVQREKVKKERNYLIFGVIVLGIACTIIILTEMERGKNKDISSINQTAISNDMKISAAKADISFFDVMDNWQQREEKSTEILKGSYEIESLSDGSKFAWLQANASIRLKNTADLNQIEIKGFMPMDIHKKANIDSVELKVLIDGKEVHISSYTEDEEVLITLEKSKVLENLEEDYITIEFQTTSQINQFELGILDDNRNLSWRINSIYLK